MVSVSLGGASGTNVMSAQGPAAVLAVSRHWAGVRGGEGEEHFCTHGCRKSGSGPYHDLRQHPGCRMRKGVHAVRALGRIKVRGSPGVQEGQGGVWWVGVSPFSLGKRSHRREALEFVQPFSARR